MSPAGSLVAEIVRLAELDPSAPAVLSAAGTTSRADLHATVVDLVAKLAGCGIGPRSRVLIAVEPGPDHVAAVLAVATLGACCLPGPPDSDTASAGGASAVVTASGPATSGLLDVRAVPSQPGAPRVDDDAEGDDPAALLSGSQDAPVALRWTSLGRTVEFVNALHGIGPDDRVLALAPVTSELAFYDIFGLLSAGGAIVVPDAADRRNPAAWAAQIHELGVTVWNGPPSLTSILVAHLRGSRQRLDARAVLLSGEPLGVRLVQRIGVVARPGVQITYLGAAGDTGIWSTHQVVDEAADGTFVAIGTALPHRSAAVLGDDRTPSPVWVGGQVHVGEQGDPPTRPTGQFGRMRPDGTIEYLGDAATRFFVHGHPLNLRTVESALGSHPAVESAAVVQLPGGDGTAAYVVLDPERAAVPADVTGEVLRDFLRRKVSPYLLPRAVHIAFGFPLTVDGRTDRVALTEAAGVAAAVVSDTAAPAGPAGSDLMAPVSELAARMLGLNRIEPNANLMDLGATSLDLVRLATAVEDELGLAVDVAELMQFPSLAVLVSRLGKVADVSPGAARERPAAAADPDRAGAPATTGGILVRVQDRQAFTDRQPGVRHQFDDAEGVAMAAPGERQILLRRTHREFDPRVVPLDAFTALVGALREVRERRAGKRWYPSAGSSYAVQVFATVRSGRVEGLPGGCFYHHPVRNVLVPVTPAVAMDEHRHDEVNRGPAREAAFALHLVGRTDAIVPLYGDRSMAYLMFEAGTMTQILMNVAADLGIGLCPIAGMDTADLVGALGLDDSDELLHTVLGGAARSSQT